MSTKSLIYERKYCTKAPKDVIEMGLLSVSTICECTNVGRDIPGIFLNDHFIMLLALHWRNLKLHGLIANCKCTIKFKFFELLGIGLLIHATSFYTQFITFIHMFQDFFSVSS